MLPCSTRTWYPCSGIASLEKGDESGHISQPQISTGRHDGRIGEIAKSHSKEIVVSVDTDTSVTEGYVYVAHTFIATAERKGFRRPVLYEEALQSDKVKTGVHNPFESMNRKADALAKGKALQIKKYADSIRVEFRDTDGLPVCLDGEPL